MSVLLQTMIDASIVPLTRTQVENHPRPVAATEPIAANGQPAPAFGDGQVRGDARFGTRIRSRAGMRSGRVCPEAAAFRPALRGHETAVS
jgi:hypothetical protein